MPTRFSSVVLVAVACQGCVTHRERAPVEMPESLSWLREGTTERAELLAHFGEPLQSFDDGSIQTWELDKHLHSTGHRRDQIFCLVVVFEGAGRVERASLVKAR